MPPARKNDLALIKMAAHLLCDRWTVPIIWACLEGNTRFDKLGGELGVARNILSNRLMRLVDAGLLEKRPVCCGARRLEYAITPKGQELRPAIEQLIEWQGRHGVPPDKSGAGPGASTDAFRAV